MRSQALHALAWMLLRACPPMRAHAILVGLGAWLAPIETPDEARRVARTLAGHGTCLSRALALAARAPAADVVIGVAVRGDSPLLAHAWVEMNGAPIDPSEVTGSPIARLRGPRSTSSREPDRA
ncbi:MAG: lasso peptide biosynthesis B2 protein [Polyangiaceae bacterium]